jgi:hypothetical protein
MARVYPVSQELVLVRENVSLGCLRPERRGELASVIKLLYKPFGTLLGVLAGVLAGMIFKRAWRAVAHAPDAPDAKDKQRGWAEVVSAAAIEGTVFGAVKAIVDRAGATGFERVTGVWPGDTAPKGRK